MEKKKKLKMILNVEEQIGPCKYLGMPIMEGCQKKIVFQFVKEKLKHRIDAWKIRWLSRTGKDILLKIVAQALPTYIMSLYLFPNSICQELYRIMNAVW